ncbi:MAG TPA: alkaline phosphatase family protein [Planctomycetota bacterium]
MTRLAIVGIDGGTLQVIRPMIAAGELPHIARVMREGVSGELESERPPITPPAWASLLTGLNPGRHGIYHFVRRELGTYGVKLVDSRNFAGKDILSLLGRRGWSASSFGTPMTYPPFPVRGGYMVAGIPVPLEGDSMCWPREMKAELDAFLGRPYRPDVDFAPYEGDVEKPADDLERYGRLRDELFQIERDRLRAAREWLRRKPTDFYINVVTCTDRCQHYFWKFQDRRHPGWSEEGERLYGGVIRDAYRLADEMVGMVREEVGDAVPIVVLSDHGAGTFTRDFFVNRWLEEQGLLVRRRVPYFTWGRTHLADALGRVGLRSVGRLLGPLGRVPIWRPKVKRVADARDIVWEKTRAFTTMYGICINVKGREPKGVIEPGAEYERTVADIESRLGALAGPDGKPIVDRVLVSNQFYTGPHAGEAPDILYGLDGLACLPTEFWDSPVLFKNRRTAGISGQHRFEGMFAMAGPGIPPGGTVTGMHIQDTTPTLLHAVGEAVPRWMEGRIRTEILGGAAEPEWDESPEPAAGLLGAEAFTADETAAIEESLRGLGYLQ